MSLSSVTFLPPELIGGFMRNGPMKDTKLSLSSFARYGLCAILSLFAVSCSVFSPAVRLAPAELRVEELQNGYFVEIMMDRPARDATTLLTHARWLTITVTDTLLDTVKIAAYRSASVDSTIVRRFETATQYSLRFTKPVSSAEILRRKELPGIRVSVFF